ncbi:hypothetical protein [Pararcticibacter amylolyticus]|nr:hypothetical protein [Pararcticibacter amylolyticus]
MKLLIFLLSIVGAFFSTSCAVAQSHIDSIQTKPGYMKSVNETQSQFNFYMRSVRGDSTRAVRVLQIQNAYKAALKELEASQALSQEDRVTRIKTLMADRNRKLTALLARDQFEKIIPATERSPSSQQ